MSKIELVLETKMPAGFEHWMGKEPLQKSVEFNLFDRNLKHIGHKSWSEGASFDGLEQGTYKVTARMPDGKEEERLIVLDDEVKPAKFDLDLGEQRPAFGVDLLQKTLQSVPLSMRLSDAAFSKLTGSVPERRDNDQSETELVSVEGATGDQLGQGRWTFKPTEELRIPQAVFETGEQRVEVALPAALSDGGPLSCTVDIRSSSRKKAGAWVDVDVTVPSRRLVFKSMLAMMDIGRMDRAAEMAEKAKDVLYDKYTDPIAATYGALLLFQMGRLSKKPYDQWAGNLFQRFKWITDVRILEIAARTLEANYDAEDYQTLLDCCTEPVLFTTAYSMLITQLRQWEGELSDEQKTAGRMALERLADHNTHIDWNLPTVVVRIPINDKPCA